MGMGRVHTVIEATSAELESWLRDILVKKFEVPAAALVPGARLKEDLGLESLDFVDLVVEFECRAGRRIETEDLPGLKTFEDVVALLVKMNAKQGAAPASGLASGAVHPGPVPADGPRKAS